MTPEQGDAIDVGRVFAFFQSELYRRMERSGNLRREFKFSLLVPALEFYPQAAADPGQKVLLQGVIDCFFEEEDGLVVVDFKTDHIRPGQEKERAKSYARQIGAYGRALAEITGKPVKQLLLVFLQTGRVMEEKNTCQTS